MSAAIVFLVLGFIGIAIMMSVVVRLVAWFLVLVCIFVGVALSATIFGILLIDFVVRLLHAA